MCSARIRDGPPDLFLLSFCTAAAIQASLKGDRRRRVDEAGTAVEALLGEDLPNAKEAWRRMKGWYQAAAKRGLPPAPDMLERITAERTELYIQVPSPSSSAMPP